MNMLMTHNVTTKSDIDTGEKCKYRVNYFVIIIVWSDM